VSESLTAVTNTIPATTGEWLEKVCRVEQQVRKMEQITVQTEHVLHAGMYARTVRLAANVIIVSVLIKVPTTLIVNGSARVFAGDKWHTLEGYNVIAASAGRKMIYVTMQPTEITMLFPTKAKTIEQTEQEFTDETEGLLSRTSDHDSIVITSEHLCQE